MSKIRNIRKKILLLCGSLLFGLFVSELMLWVCSVSHPLPYTPDPFCGTRLRANFSGLFTKEGKAYVETNSAGHRDVERVVSKPADTIRIAVLGDSFAEALQVDASETFWSLLESQFEDEKPWGDKKVEVLNFGVSGYGTAQELQMLRNYVWRYDPDYVMLAFFSGNDVVDNSATLRGGQVKPYYTIVADQLVLDESFKELDAYQAGHSSLTKFKVWCINHSRLLQLANVWKDALQNGNKPKGRFAELVELGLDPKIYVAPETDDWKAAWEVTFRLLQEMNAEVKSRGAKFSVVSLSNAIQVDPDIQKRKEFIEEHGIENLYFADKKVEGFCRAESIPCLTLAPKLSQAVVQHQLETDSPLFLHGFSNTSLGSGHWNEKGHALAAQLIFQSLLQWYPNRLADRINEGSDDAAAKDRNEPNDR